MLHRGVVLAILAATATLALSGVATAAARATADPAQVVAEARDRLKLTPEQEAQLKPLFEERNRKLKAVRDQHGGDTSRAGKRAMFRDAKPIQQEYEKQVRAILTDEQEAEWEAMRKEAAQRMRERYRAGQAPE